MMNIAARLARLLPVALLVAPAVAHADTSAQDAPIVVAVPAAPALTPVALPPPPVAPAQNEDWNNVSHINGQLVPVGDRTQYLYAFRKTNISTNPIGWIFGYYGLSVTEAVHPNIAIRADANYMSINDTRSYELGVSAPIYFKRAYSGPFVEPGLIVRGAKTMDNLYCAGSTTSCTPTAGSWSTMYGPEMLFGWHWSFDSGLNVAAAFGAARDLSPRTTEYSSDWSKISPAGYFRIGYEF